MQIFGIISVTGFLVAALVHISTFQKQNPFLELPVFILHPLALIVFIAMILTMNSRGEINSEKGKGFKSFSPEFMRSFPVWSKLLFGIVAAYAVVNFVLFTVNTPRAVSKNDVSKNDENGKTVYMFRQHGAIPGAVATKADYDETENRQVRAFSGHWMIFFLMPALYFLMRRPQLPVKSGK